MQRAPCVIRRVITHQTHRRSPFIQTLRWSSPDALILKPPGPSANPENGAAVRPDQDHGRQSGGLHQAHVSVLRDGPAGLLGVPVQAGTSGVCGHQRPQRHGQDPRLLHGADGGTHGKRSTVGSKNAKREIIHKTMAIERFRCVRSVVDFDLLSWMQIRS